MAADSAGLTILPVPLWEDGVDSHPTVPAEVTFGKQTLQGGRCLRQRSLVQQRISSGPSREEHRVAKTDPGGAARCPPLKPWGHVSYLNL